MKSARVGVYWDEEMAGARRRRGENVFGGYVGEILSHAGIPFLRLHRPADITSADTDVLIVALAGKEALPAVWKLAERGGEVLVSGSFPELAEKVGAVERVTDGAGYARVPELGDGWPPLRFLRASPWKFPRGGLKAGGGTLSEGSPGGRFRGAFSHRVSVGKGAVTHWAVNVPETVVSLQQGTRPVKKDGLPAPDGTADIDDGILKADDGFELDWEWDREVTPTGEKYFAHPYADGWREVLLRWLFQRVLARGWTLPFVDYWPQGVSQVALISLDSDWNVDASAETTLDLLEEYGVPATWCIMEPGFRSCVYAKAVARGHELALHYNAYERDGGSWGREAFSRQLRWLTGAVGREVVSNKNHYTRLEGWGELYRWCEEHGIRSDQTRGPSKKGNIGFLFGTCHPYFPAAWADEDNRIYDVLEIGFLTQDLNLARLADTSVIVPFLEGVKRVRGVAHFLFHPIHLHREEPVRRALRQVVREGEKRGFRFWTGEQIDDWERRRRRIRLMGVDGEGRPVVEGGTGCSEAVVMVPIPESTGLSDEETEVRFGVRCRKWPVHRLRNLSNARFSAEDT